MKAFKEFSKTGVGRVLVIGIIILFGISSVILNKLIEEINYKNLSSSAEKYSVEVTDVSYD